MKDPLPPRTGTITIEWVDGSEPGQEPNFGWSLRSDPPLDDERTIILLREIAETL